ncbi:acyl-CoA dehydrogenase [Solihabitans fulvus]|uniref:Acyl-CoA dehydrogenase n=1 Tax=Solihabitans fulvus TaxID=1892852 RepID=A0A5B2XSW6_9PSEU|nr:acyl-CoA dehydrogenase family protein [Solihabitans fulvus]KAA2266546.1 acyl-CoA dehydrogenase [Solihabitans fulvus]
MTASTALADAVAFARSAREEAGGWDRRGAIPTDVLDAVAGAGFLAVDVPAEHGGLGRSPAELGELCAAFGGACSALRGLVTVQGMVAAAVLRWGDREQRARWLPALASGARRAAFAATEPGAGTDLSAATTSATPTVGGLRVRGRKLWVTFGAVADVYLVLAALDGKPVAVLVEADRAGVTVEPIGGQLGMRAAHLANLRFDDVVVPQENLVGAPGFGLSHVVATALDHGRFTVAWGCVGLAEACLDLAAAHVGRRSQGGVRLAEHETVRALLGRDLVEASAARRLCEHAAELRARADADAIAETVLAKYAAARAASALSEHAVQLHGAAGCAQDSTVGRFFRDAKVMRIIEGADEPAELRLGEYALRRPGRSR